MSEQNLQSDSLREVKDIRQLMERSSRFISLSGLSGIAAGTVALVGAAITRYVLLEDYYANKVDSSVGISADTLRLRMLVMAIAVFGAAFITSFYFTWRNTRKEGQPLWNPVSRRLAWNMTIPLLAGAFFILGLLKHEDAKYVAPACLLFYGLALINASKYTFSDIRYLGYCEIVLGIVNMQWLGYGIYFWALGFGVLHILYGMTMWWKYERKKK